MNLIKRNGFFFSSKVPSNHHWLNFNIPVVMFHCLYKYSAILLDSHNTCNWQVIKRCILICYYKKRPFKNYEGTLFGHMGANLGQYNHFILLKRLGSLSNYHLIRIHTKNCHADQSINLFQQGYQLLFISDTLTSRFVFKSDKSIIIKLA